MGLKISGQLLALLGFILVCLTATFVITALLPTLVPRERTCPDHDVKLDQLLLTAPSGKRLKVQLNLNNTAKRSGKYFHCGDSSAAYVRQNADPAANASCRLFEWRLTQSVKEVTDCFDMSGEFWFGGAEMWRQDWPLNTGEQVRTAYVPSDVYLRQFGGAIERFWISTGGFAVFVEDSVPLYVSISGGRLCLSGSRSAEVYGNLAARNPGDPLLAYSVCSGADIKSLYRATQFWRGPSETPERDLFERPVWSTWAYLKAGITQESVLEFAHNISANALPASSQLGSRRQMDGELRRHVFDTARFPDPAAMGYNLTLWVHPFVNKDSEAFATGAQVTRRNGSFLLTSRTRLDEPAFTSWWRGANLSAAMVDITDVEGAPTPQDGLRRGLLQAGCRRVQLAARELPPSRFRQPQQPRLVRERLGRLRHPPRPLRRRQEVRVGFRAQHLPLTVRAIDKDSHWGLDNGLKAMVTSALLHCLIGYNFHLPDMVGGNAYCEGPDGLDGNCYPDRELYIRWLQATVLMPSLQLSVPPWHYDEEVVNISRRLLAIRSEPRFRENMKSALADLLANGDPLLRPMWWLKDGRPGQRRPVPAGPFDLSGPGAGARRKIPQGALPQRPVEALVRARGRVSGHCRAARERRDDATRLGGSLLAGE
uniref:P-type domain-containing protein n=1 Tax=Macrostomum lignano TaxID=282301 RepID=A0A1I8HBG8_9PLAT